MDGVLGGVVLAGVVEDESNIRHEGAGVAVLHRVQRLRHRPDILFSVQKNTRQKISLSRGPSDRIGRADQNGYQ